MMVGKKTIETWDIAPYWLTLPEFSRESILAIQHVTVNCRTAFSNCDTVFGFTMGIEAKYKKTFIININVS
jgi:hypothetical protein